MNYWQVKAAVLEHQLRTAQAQAALDRVMLANGLNPAKSHTFDDKAETVTPVPEQTHEPRA